MCSSFQMPRSSGVMRPSGTTAVASNDDEAGAALRAAAEMDQMPVVGEAVVGGVLAHGRDADAVGKGDGTKLQSEKKRGWLMRGRAGIYKDR